MENNSQENVPLPADNVMPSWVAENPTVEIPKNPNQKPNPNQKVNPSVNTNSNQGPNGNINPNFKAKKSNFGHSDFEFDGIIES